MQYLVLNAHGLPLIVQNEIQEAEKKILYDQLCSMC